MTTIASKTVGVDGIDIPPIGAFVMASFGEVKVPFDVATKAAKDADLDLRMRLPNMSDALAIAMQDVPASFAKFIEEDRKRHPDVESMTWAAKKTGRGEYVVHRIVLVEEEQGRLQQPNVLRAWIEEPEENKGEPQVRVEMLDTRVASERKAWEAVADLVGEWQQHLNAARIRSAYLGLLDTLDAVPWMPRGVAGVVFVPAAGLPKVEAFATFMETVEKYRTSSYDFAIRFQEQWETKRVLAHLKKDVEDEVNRRLDELAEKTAKDVLAAKDAERLEKILERRLSQRADALKIATTYQDLLRAKVLIRKRIEGDGDVKKAMERLNDKGMSDRAKALFRSVLSREVDVE